jgi:hypothetical protein
LKKYGYNQDNDEYSLYKNLLPSSSSFSLEKLTRYTPQQSVLVSMSYLLTRIIMTRKMNLHFQVCARNENGVCLFVKEGGEGLWEEESLNNEERRKKVEGGRSNM